KFQSLKSQIDRQGQELRELSEQMEILARESLTQVGSEVHTLRGKFQKYKRRGVIWAIGMVLWGVLLLGSFGFVTYFLQQELKNQHLVASGNIALAVQDYQGAENYFRQTKPNWLIGIAEDERNRLIALAQAGKHIEMGNQYLSDGRHDLAAKEYKLALNLFGKYHLVPDHVKKRIHRVEDFAKAQKLSAQGKLFLALQLYNKIGQEKTDLPGSLYARAMSALLTERLKTMAQEKIQKGHWIRAFEIYSQLAKIYPEKKLYQDLANQTEEMDLAMKALKNGDSTKALQHFNRAGNLASLNPLFSIILESLINYQNISVSKEALVTSLLGKDSPLLKRWKFERMIFEGQKALDKQKWKQGVHFFQQALQLASGLGKKEVKIAKNGMDKLKKGLQREVLYQIKIESLKKARELAETYFLLFPNEENDYQELNKKIKAQEYMVHARKEENISHFEQAFEYYRKAQFYEESEQRAEKIQFLASLLLKKEIEKGEQALSKLKFLKASAHFDRAKRYLSFASSLQNYFEEVQTKAQNFQKWVQKSQEYFQAGNLKKAYFFAERAKQLYFSEPLVNLKAKILEKINQDYLKLVKMAETLLDQGNWEAAKEALLAAQVIKPKGEELGKLKDKLYRSMISKYFNKKENE
ncbi:MAG: hypothetical protein D6785_14005, partial [Planctomycetota bacterium]